ncbi:primosomal protein N' [Candidatus Dependentiae bacterium]|nr:MAG: primosomal protein N' [Candidatus Dependentiae bacterium]
MYAQVLLCNGYKKPLWYGCNNTHGLQKGSLVKVPLRTQTVVGIVLSLSKAKPFVQGSIKDILGVELLPDDPFYLSFVYQLAQYYALDTLFFIKRIQHFLHEKAAITLNVDAEQNYAVQMPLLTAQQEKVCAFLRPYIINQQHVVTLLHGVTGSGKTEVYKQCIITAQEQHKTVILLLPEVTLAIEFEYRLRMQMANKAAIYGFHSGKTAKQKQEIWQQLQAKKPIVIIGVHLPILLPISNLGLIIIDEEHDHGFQEKKHPKINSKEAAIVRAKMMSIPILLGSATPCVRSLYAVKQGKWKFFQLTERFGGAFPQVQVVSLKEQKERRKHFWITNQLKEAIALRLAKKEQSILFLNRRGVSFFVQCKQCAYVCICNACSVSLTLHEHNILKCHYCGFSMAIPTNCAGCKTQKADWLKKGIGTQQAVTILQDMFPQAVIARADMDTTSKKKEWQNTVERIKNGSIDIIVGTQTVTKGYHFPKVTLVGVIWADMQLHFPTFNATEIATQQLIQVAGRAGRASTDSQVIVQMMDEHPITTFLHEVNYVHFFAQEIENRKALLYPPAGVLVEIELKHAAEIVIEQESHALAQNLNYYSKQYKGMYILGPVKNMVHKIQHIESRVIFIKGASLIEAIHLYNHIEKHLYASRLFFTPFW